MTRHRTDPVSLVFGLVFVGIAVAAWNGVLRLDTVVDLRWVWPVLLIGGGLTLLAGITRSGDELAAPDTASAPGSPADPGWESPPTDG